MVVLQGTQAVLRPLLDFVRLFAESQAEENMPVSEFAASVREFQTAQNLQQSVFVESCLPRSDYFLTERTGTKAHAASA